MSSDPFRFRVGTLLRWANTLPGALHQQDFYRLKQAVCERFGTLVGKDIQRIEKKCWECGGTGFITDWDGNQEFCHRCSCGIYDVVYVELERWNVGGKVFHRPIGRIKSNETRTTIHGLIKHQPSCIAVPSAIALAKLFSQSLYWKFLQAVDPRKFPRTVVQSSKLANIAAKHHSLYWRLEFSNSLLELSLPPVEERW